jgi:2-polyprenyl-6-methoxyphenol hydroxylase-like FAD-dependent oxidoreductase
MTGLGMSVMLEDAVVLADAITEALAGNRPAHELIAGRYLARQDVHRRLATTYPNPAEYHSELQRRLYCGDR